MLGLIANNFVRVAPPGEPLGLRRPPPHPVMTNVTIEAAILSLQHSFIVDNYDVRQARHADRDGRDRPEVPRTGRHRHGDAVASGYLKNYWYDDRFRYRSPPYFLTPVDAAWDVVRVHEYVKGSPLANLQGAYPPVLVDEDHRVGTRRIGQQLEPGGHARFDVVRWTDRPARRSPAPGRPRSTGRDRRPRPRPSQARGPARPRAPRRRRTRPESVNGAGATPAWRRRPHSPRGRALRAARR